MIWLAFALMTAAVALALVWPLASKRPGVEARAADVDFYKSQIAEVQGDLGRGAISPDEAEATRTEIARRLIASAQTAGPAPQRPSRNLRLVAVVAAVGLVPALSMALYLRVGSPGQPDAPLVARAEPPGLDLAAAIPRIEAHLAAAPDDGRGWALLAPVYMRLGRYDDAVKAYTAALRVLGEDATRRADLGQAIAMAADGVVTEQAQAAFDQALRDDPKLPEARFFQGLAAEQGGDKGKARTLWQAMLDEAPTDAPWRASVVQRIAALDGTAAPQSGTIAPMAGPATATGAVVAALPPQAQMQAIHGMVDGLAARLAQNGRDCDGWLRLIRAYKVLGEQDRARTALGDARKGLEGDTASLARVDALGRELGLEG